MSHLLAFALVGLIAVAVPGPDFAVVTRNALLNRRFGIFTVGGIGTGLALHAILASVGLSALLLASATAFSVVKVAGALYLAWLGIQSLASVVRARRSSGSTKVPPTTPLAKKSRGSSRPSSARVAFRQGLLTNVLNPKAVFFFISLLPQFVPDGGSIAGWTALFGLTQVLIALVWFSVVAMLVATVSSALTRPRVSLAIDSFTGMAFIGFAARLAFLRR